MNWWDGLVSRFSDHAARHEDLDQRVAEVEEQVERVEEQAEENAREMRVVAAAAGIQDLRWWRRHRDTG